MEDRVASSTHTILELLAKNNTRATFFVLGCVAANHPDLVKRISNAGHEIGCHGNWHRLIYKQSREEFREDIVTAKHILEDIMGQEVNLYRAPSWSISSSTLWALEVLEEEGFICDSSIQPFQTPLSGISGAPVQPFRPVINGKKLNMVEFPPTVLPIGKYRIPFAGGFYLRALPVKFISWALTQVNRERPGMVYVHPWETDVEQPRCKVPAYIRTTHYLNIHYTLPKLAELLRSFSFAPLGEIIESINYPSWPVVEQKLKHLG